MSVAAPIVTVLVAWFLATGGVLWLAWRREAEHPPILVGLTALAALGFAAMLAGGGLEPAPGAYLTFAGVLAAWAWAEFAFLSGTVTGTRREPCPEDADRSLRFRLAFRTVNLHEYALLALVVGSALASMAVGRPDALIYMGTLWIMRVSAKLTLFDGAPRFSSDLLPHRLAHMETYFRRDRVGPIFWFSTVASTLFVAGATLALATGTVAESYTVTLCLTLTLVALAALEHWLMVLPVRDSRLWSWAVPRHAGVAEPAAVKGT